MVVSPMVVRMTDLAAHWGKRIKAEREARSWTQADLAREAKIAHQTVAAIEQGRRIPSDTLRLRLAGVFGIDPNDLFAYPAEVA